MKTPCLFLLAGMTAACAAPPPPVYVVPLNTNPPVSPAPETASTTPPAPRQWSPAELDQLVAPVGLCADPLLMQILRASTHPLQIVGAASHVRNSADLNTINQQPWDVDVKTVAHYPEIIKMMGERLEWTCDLGEAYLHQPTELMAAVERLRAQAGTSDSLPPTPRRSAAELDKLLAPVALYPDPLLAHILPASTHAVQIVLAVRYAGGREDTTALDQQTWDASVQAVAHYPTVLKMMDTLLAWTTAVGEAFRSQPAEVMAAVQRLRAQAEAAGNLQSTPQQQVVVDKRIVKILPAEKQIMYVPIYDPAHVYSRPPVPGDGAETAGVAITFGAGLATGPWLCFECDWGQGAIIGPLPPPPNRGVMGDGSGPSPPEGPGSEVAPGRSAPE